MPTSFRSRDAIRWRRMNNNPQKIVGIDGYGLKIVERVPIVIPPQEHDRHYLETKKMKMGHLLDGIGQSE